MKTKFDSEKTSNDLLNKKEQPDKRHVSFLNFVLFFAAFLNLICAVLNFALKFHKHYIVIGLLEAGVAAATAVVIIYYRKTKKHEVTAKITVLLLTIILIMFFALVENNRYGFYWISIYPPTVYFLLERHKANIVVGLFCIYVFLFMISPHVSWESYEIMIDSIINIFGATAVLVLVINFFEMGRTDAVNELKEKNNELHGLIVIDYLTGLFNRIKLDEELRTEIKKAAASTSIFSIIMADLDNFKSINDNYGHLSGDSVLVDTAQILKQGCRKTDIVGRWGGEEFLIICPQTDKNKAKKLCERLIDNILKYRYVIEEKLTISFGVAEYIKGDSPDTILNRVDKALYKAKAKGKCRIEIL